MAPAVSTKPAEPILRLTPAGWRAWLAAHHATSTGVLLALTKAGAPPPLLSYPQALEVALAWGWIDGQKRPLDAHRWLQRFTPRRARSPWSKVNRAKAQALIAAGKMRPSGMAEVERAKKDGRWAAAYDSARTSVMPVDLATALAANQRAAGFFRTLDAANRYAILYRVQTAKKPETRAARIERFVSMLARHETLHPARKSDQHRPKTA
jgi:uncharacterized protein YdeI (YjbR/CyaY-like superfamily)